MAIAARVEAVVVSFAEALALVVVGATAGIVSTVASLASVVSYPALLALGLPPLSANMTNTVALLFTSAGAAAGSRPELAGQGGRVWRLGLVTALGGLTGAALLLITPAGTFQRAAPVLIGVASLIILRPHRLRTGPRSTAQVGRPSAPESAPAPESTPATATGHRLLVVGVFAVAIYVGYFGAAGGILMLAVLTPMFAQSLPRTNAVKNVIGGFANGVAALAFALFGHLDWAVAAPLGAGFLIGGWTGPALVRRIPARALRILIALAGLAVSVKLGLSAYRAG
jgi:uncharacterized membrane protein YfcA